MSIIDAMRDAGEGYNTLVRFADLSGSGLKILVISDRVGKDYKNSYVSLAGFEESCGLDDFFEYGYSRTSGDYCLFINAEHVSKHALGDKSDDSLFQVQLEEAARELKKAEEDRLEYRDRDRYYEIENAHENAERIYEMFRPSQLTRLIRQADVVIAQPDIADKIASQIPGANLALFEAAENGTEVSYFQPSERNYPRVQVRGSDYPGSGNEFERIDQKTVKLLFQEESKSVSHYDSLFERFDRSERFDEYGGIRVESLVDELFGVARPSIDERFTSMMDSVTNPVERSTKMVDLPATVEYITEFDKAMIPARTEAVWANMYGLEKSHDKYSGAEFRLMGMRRKKEIKTLHYLESFWSVPLETADEILERQQLVGELVENRGHRENVRELARSLNMMVEPYIHISSLSKLISANFLGSRWGGEIDKELFYKDFVRISQEFVSHYEKAMQHSAKVNSSSREMQVLVEPLKALLGVKGTSELYEAYMFVKSIAQGSPADFTELEGHFGREIKRAGLEKSQELESYDLYADEEFIERERESWEMKKKEGKIGPDEEFDIKKIKPREGYETSKFERLVHGFHRKTPISRADDLLYYLDNAGSKLAAFSAMADYIENEGWCKPQILPGEDRTVEIVGGWYPLITLQHTSAPVPNDTVLNDKRRVEIIDGPNITGKTVDLRKTAFIISTALAGTYVPAKEARISLFDYVRFRLKGTGMHLTGALVEEVEDINSAHEVLEEKKSVFTAFDETFTSTNDLEGESLTYSFIRKLAAANARAVITSHYPSLHELLGDPEIENVVFSHFEYNIGPDGQLVFPHQKQDGPNTNPDYAIPIAESEGVPAAILKHAKGFKEV